MRDNGLSKIPCGCLRNTLGRLRDTSPSPDSNDPGLVDSRVVDYANTATETCLASCAFDGCELKDRHTRERQEVLPPHCLVNCLGDGCGEGFKRLVGLLHVPNAGAGGGG